MIRNSLVLGSKREQTTPGMKLLSSAANYALGLSSSRKCMLSLSLLYKHSLSSPFTPPPPPPLHQYRLLSSWSSSSTSEYDLFFPSFNQEFLSNIIERSAYRIRTEDPVDPRYFDTEPPFALRRTCIDFEEEPHYICDDVEALNIKKGHHLDVISLLSSYSDDLVRTNDSCDFVKTNTLRGKYILLCCGFVPSVWNDSTSYRWRELSILSSELYKGYNTVEVVIVPKVRQKWEDDEGVLHHFFSAFPGCLTLPFAHKYRRDHICKALNFSQSPRFILVDPSQKVLQYCKNRIFENGAGGLPFSDDCVESIGDEDKDALKSLAGLLGCQSNPSFLLRKFGSEETTSVEQLNKHLVGLYLFNLGDQMLNIVKIYKQCRLEGLDFEVVLVCLPFNLPIHPEMFQDVVNCALKNFPVSNWWVFPFNNTICRRLQKFCNRPRLDSMVIVGPHNKFVSTQAGEILRRFSYHFDTEAYPFTFNGLLQAFLRRFDTVTLKSFLRYERVYRDYECDESKMMPVSELKGKNVLVYVTNAWRNIVCEDPDAVVVLVPLRDEFSGIDFPSFCSNIRKRLLQTKPKWLVCPFHEPKYHRYLSKHEAFVLRCGVFFAMKGVLVPSALAFGKDGHLNSIEAIDVEGDGRDKADPFGPESRNSNLSSEIATQLFFEFGIEQEDNSS